MPAWFCEILVLRFQRLYTGRRANECQTRKSFSMSRLRRRQPGKSMHDSSRRWYETIHHRTLTTTTPRSYVRCRTLTIAYRQRRRLLEITARRYPFLSFSFSPSRPSLSPISCPLSLAFLILPFHSPSFPLAINPTTGPGELVMPVLKSGIVLFLTVSYISVFKRLTVRK